MTAPTEALVAVPAENNLAPSIVILKDVKTMSGGEAALYYHEGNFFYPFLSVHGSDIGRVRKAIRTFEKENPDLVLADRKSPLYLTLEQLHDAGLKMAGVEA